MKIKIQYLVIIFLLVGCTQSVKYRTYIDTKYPPTKNVEVLRIKPVDRDFIELGELKLNLNKSNTDTAILILKDKAKSIGADAIIVQEPMDEGYISTGSFFIPVRSVNAIALRYKN